MLPTSTHQPRSIPRNFPTPLTLPLCTPQVSYHAASAPPALPNARTHIHHRPMTNITLRTHLIGNVTDFCTESNLPFITPAILVDLIVHLSRYQEEGARLFPQVYLTDNIDSLVRMLPHGERLLLRTTTPTTEGIRDMLKACAPIATRDWRVFGNYSAGAMSFGVFRGSSSPIAVPVDDVLLVPPTDTPVIKAHQVADECVQIRNSKGAFRHILFNHEREDSPPPLQHLQDFIASVTQRVDEGDKDTVQSYLQRIISEALSTSHGCLWAVTSMNSPPKFLRDGIFFDRPIDFHDMIKRLGASDMSLDVLDRKAEVVRGMLCCDGISLFDQRARLLGYRCFVSIPRSSGVVGGARKRAFAALKRRLRKGLISVFFQSQDGLTQFESKRNG